jgi:hypothetical protein
MATTQWRLDAYLKVRSPDGQERVLMVEALWLQVYDTEHSRAVWARMGRKRCRQADGDEVLPLADGSFQLHGMRFLPIDAFPMAE